MNSVVAYLKGMGKCVGRKVGVNTCVRNCETDSTLKKKKKKELARFSLHCQSALLLFRGKSNKNVFVQLSAI